MSELYTKNQVETALVENGYGILQETGGLTIYHTNMYPGNDLVLDWSKDEYDWGDLQAQLEFHDIDPQPIYERLQAK